MLRHESEKWMPVFGKDHAPGNFRGSGRGSGDGPYRGSRHHADLRHARRHGAGRLRRQLRHGGFGVSLHRRARAGAASRRCSISSPVFSSRPSGEIRIGGAPVNGYGMDRGVVFQDFAQLFPWRTALGNVAFGLEMKGMPKAERETVALEQLRLVKLENFARSYPHHLSGGMQQRVAIARALAYNPAVLLMDEPFAALDAFTRDDMQRLLADVWRTTRKTVIYVTHNVAEAVYLADRVVVMTPHPGKMKTEVPIRLPRPRDPLSVEFLDYQKELLRLLGQDKRSARDPMRHNQKPEIWRKPMTHRSGLTRRQCLAAGSAGALVLGLGATRRAAACRQYPPGLPDQYLGHADLLPDEIRLSRKARCRGRGIRRAVRQPHHAADGRAPGRSRHLCRTIVHHRQRQGRIDRHCAHRTCRQDRAHHDAQGSQHHQGRAVARTEGRQPDRLVGRAMSSSTPSCRSTVSTRATIRKSAWT